jgi:hypothetical protein
VPRRRFHQHRSQAPAAGVARDRARIRHPHSPSARLPCNPRHSFTPCAVWRRRPHHQGASWGPARAAPSKQAPAPSTRHPPPGLGIRQRACGAGRGCLTVLAARLPAATARRARAPLLRSGRSPDPRRSPESNPSKFIQIVPVAGAALLAGHEAFAQGKARGERPQAKALGYARPSAIGEQDQAAQVRPRARTAPTASSTRARRSDAAGGCPLFPRAQQVSSAKGWWQRLGQRRPSRLLTPSGPTPGAQEGARGPLTRGSAPDVEAGTCLEAGRGRPRAASLARRRQVGGQLPCATSAAMPMLSPSVGCGWMVLPMSTASAPISMASAISPIMSPACVPTMPPPRIAVAWLGDRTAAW